MTHKDTGLVSSARPQNVRYVGRPREKIGLEVRLDDGLGRGEDEPLGSTLHNCVFSHTRAVCGLGNLR